ncbi:MAG: hypothetical protein ACFFD6_04735, partial [Candidatus Thorarchaeota archaeon]
MDRRGEIESLLKEFLLSIDEDQRPSAQFIDGIMENWQNNRIEILGKIDDRSKIRGIAVLGMVSNRISFLYVNGRDRTREEIDAISIELFNTSFERLRNLGNWVMTGVDVLKGRLRTHAI